MSILIPVKKSLDNPPSLVGHKGLLFSHLEESVNIPFSIIISSEVFDSFIRENDLERLIKREKDLQLDEEISALFQEASYCIMNGSFPPNMVEDLRECFELVSLDPSNPDTKDVSILALRRSTNYIDEDDIIPAAKFTKNNFNYFLKSLKTCFASLFTPSSIALRKNKNISSLKCAIIVSRLPNVQNCFESEFLYHTNTIKINSYVGFIDPANLVPRDSFVLSSDFLKIVDSNIVRQDVVSIFDIATNSVSQQKFSSQGSSQSVTDQVILEVGRLTKKIASQSSVGANVKAEFLIDKNSSISCINVMFKQNSKNKSRFDISKSPEESADKLDLNNENQNEEKSANLGISIGDLTKEDSTTIFVNDLKKFLKANKHKSKFGPSIDIVIRALNNEINKDTILQAIVVVREIIDNWE